MSADDVMISQLTATVSGGLSPSAGHTGNISMSHHILSSRLSSSLTQAEVAMAIRMTTT